MNLITGDSHSERIFFNNSTHILCSGGSAKGLNNSNSKSQYNNMLINNVKNENYVNLFFLFGGVDVDFCFIHKYIENNNIDYKEFNLNIIHNYLDFIINNFSDKSVTILSVGLPCLDDENFIKGMLNAHINFLENQDINILNKKLLSCELLPNIYKRTEITLHFNEKLKEEIVKLKNPNIKFLDITSFTYDYNLKRIKDEYFTRYDHHNYTRNMHFTQIINEYLSKSEF
jgi:hypothetical protein